MCIFDTSATKSASPLFVIFVEDFAEGVAESGVVDVIDVAAGADDEVWDSGVVKPVLGEGC